MVRSGTQLAIDLAEGKVNRVEDVIAGGKRFRLSFTPDGDPFRLYDAAGQNVGKVKYSYSLDEVLISLKDQYFPMRRAA